LRLEQRIAESLTTAEQREQQLRSTSDADKQRFYSALDAEKQQLRNTFDMENEVLPQRVLVSFGENTCVYICMPSFCSVVSKKSNVSLSGSNSRADSMGEFVKDRKFPEKQKYQYQFQALT